MMRILMRNMVRIIMKIIMWADSVKINNNPKKSTNRKWKKYNIIVNRGSFITRATMSSLCVKSANKYWIFSQTRFFFAHLN